MRRVAIFPLLGPALVLYLIADVASLRGDLDVVGCVIALVALSLSLTLVGRDARSDQRGAREVAWLGFGAALGLLPLLTEQSVRASVDIAQALGLSCVGATLLHLALLVPDRIGSARTVTALRTATLGVAGVATLLSAFAVGPVFAPFGVPWLLPAWYAHASVLFSLAAVGGSLGLRLLRPGLGSGPEALASNGWAVLGLLPAAASCVLLLLGRPFGVNGASAILRLSGAGSALALYWGHLWLIDPSRRLAAGRVIRDLAALLLALAIVMLGAALLRARFVPPPAALSLWVAAAFLLGVGLFQALRPLSRRLLAPAGGALLDQLQSLERSMAGVHTLDGLARVVLGAFRRASAPAAEPLLFGFDPAFEARIDAAGEPHLSDRPLHGAILAQLRLDPAEIIVRAPLEARIVREPPLRPLIEALCALDALCVLPLVNDGELEGALILPRADRRAPLTLEELSALREHARWLSAFLAVFSAKGRAEARAHGLLLSHNRAERNIERLEDELARLRADVEVFHAARARRAEAPKLIAYSASMRTLLERLRSMAVHDVPVLLLAEAGVPVEPLARFLHAESARASEPFLVFDCAAVAEDAAVCALFGGMHEGVMHAGSLRLAAAGTLLLLDVPALPSDAQRLLVSALGSRTGRPVGGGEPYALAGTIVASSRSDLEALAARGRFDVELAARFAPTACRVPPLRERREDIASYALLAVDHACRRLGRELVGFESDALQQLSEHVLSDNVSELEQIVERAVVRCRGERISAADLALAASGARAPAEHPLEGSWEDVERRVLEHALLRAAGNKSEAARLLGLPRTTFLDKLRRHKLDDGTQTPSSPPN